MAEKKTIRKCYGPKGLIKRLEKCPWIRWNKPGTTFEGFEFDGNRLHDEAFTVKAKCQIMVTDIKTDEEFLVEGFCCPNLLAVFFLNEAHWRSMQIAGYYMTQRLSGINSNPYEVSMEVTEGSPSVD
jgi:hypothetical protein